jgi:hypothetical protein
LSGVSELAEVGIVGEERTGKVGLFRDFPDYHTGMQRLCAVESVCPDICGKLYIYIYISHS